MHGLHVLSHRPVRGEPAQRGLPGVQMAVYQPGQHHHARCVDYLGAVCSDVRCDGDDAVALDQYIALGEIADRSIHGNDGTAFDQNSIHACVTTAVVPPSEAFLLYPTLLSAWNRRDANILEANGRPPSHDRFGSDCEKLGLSTCLPLHLAERR
jgi:hypothetical protein